MAGLSDQPLRLIAAVMGVSVSTASRRLRALGIARACGGSRPHPFEEKRRGDIERLLARDLGLTQAQIGRLFGVSRQTVNKIARRLKEGMT